MTEGNDGENELESDGYQIKSHHLSSMVCIIYQ